MAVFVVLRSAGCMDAQPGDEKGSAKQQGILSADGDVPRVHHLKTAEHRSPTLQGSCTTVASR